MRQRTLIHGDAEIDLVPLIDCVFLLLLFFLLCGRLAQEGSWEQVTVPPARSAQKSEGVLGWQRVQVQLAARAGTLGICLGQRLLDGDEAAQWQALRAYLDRIHAQAERYPDPASPAGYAPKVVVELRADRDLDYRLVQKCQQILADCIDPGSDKPRDGARRAFTHLEFAALKP
jgi:biopolymer transport protein ExbD